MMTVVALTLLATHLIAPAVPIPVRDPVEIVGKISSFVWVNDTHYKYEGDDFLIVESNQPAYYLAIVETKSLDKKLRKELSSYARLTSLLTHAITRVVLKEDQILIRITSPEISPLKAGATIKISGYQMTGGDASCFSKYTDLTLDGKLIPKRAEQGAAVQPPARGELKSE